MNSSEKERKQPGKPNIILINHYAGSPGYGMEYRPYYLAREWVRNGCKVTIIAASFSHVRRSQPDFEGSSKGRQSREQIDGIDYLWYSTSPYKGNGSGRVWNITRFLWGVWRDAKKISSLCRPDVVIASSTYPLDVWVARRIAKYSGAILIYEIHDLWPLSLIELAGLSRFHPFVVLCQIAENAAYRHVDAVVSMLPLVHDHVVSHGLDPEKLQIIPNGISPEDWETSDVELPGEIRTFIQGARDGSHLIVGYAGAHGVPNALDSLLDAAKCMSDDPVRFMLVGDGHERHRLMNRLIDEGIDNVSMFPPVLKNQIPGLLQAFDIAYIGLKSEPLFRFGVSPNKLMDYMMAARPVLFSVHAGNDPVAESQCGVTVIPESPQDIVRGLTYLLEMTGEERKKMGLRGKEFVEKNHIYPVLAKRFLAVVDSLR